MEPYDVHVLAAGDTNVHDQRDGVSGYVCNHADFNFATVFETKRGQERGGFTLRAVYNAMITNNDGLWGVDWYVHDVP